MPWCIQWCVGTFGGGGGGGGSNVLNGLSGLPDWISTEIYRRNYVKASEIEGNRTYGSKNG